MTDTLNRAGLRYSLRGLRYYLRDDTWLYMPDRPFTVDGIVYTAAEPGPHIIRLMVDLIADHYCEIYGYDCDGGMHRMDFRLPPPTEAELDRFVRTGVLPPTRRDAGVTDVDF